ncbi:MAG: HlyU family transcriptional regulator [Pseudomonadota bacterium]
MSFLKKLFGGGGGDDSGAAKVMASETYEGFIIEASPMPESGQFRLRAFIRESDAEDARVETIIRADLFPSADAAAQFAITKAKQVIDEQGAGLFRS